MDTKENQRDSRLRRQAEEKLKTAAGGSTDLSGVSPEKTASLIHELRVHQIELEMQNDELRRIQDELERTRDKYFHLYDFAPVGYVTLSEKGIIEEVNLTGAAMMGTDRSALIGKPFTRFVLGDDQDIFYKHRQRLLETETSQSCELRLAKKDGHAFYARLECRVIKNRNKASRQIRAAVSDIDERKTVEEKLRQSEETFRAAFEHAPVGMCLVNPDGRFLKVNGAFCHMLGYAESELVSKTFRDITHPDDLDASNEWVRKLLTGETTFIDLEKRYIHNRGHAVWGTVRAFLIHNTDGSPHFFVTHVQDITERKSMEEGLLKAQKLEAVGMLAGGIAHDFNNILTTILGNVSLAKMQTRTEDEIFELLSEAETASTTAQALTKQLLTFAKGGTPVKEIASIKDIIKKSSLFVMRGSKSRCEFSIAEDLWLADVDTGQISQVINNIVINARQAMPEGGIIQVAAKNFIIDVQHGLPLKPGRYIRISITDQGMGIAENYLSKIFDPYFTLKSQGGGLGLAVAYSIIQKHDGYITVESKLREGTTFHIYLPAAEKPIPEKEEVRLITGRGRILVMDDDASLRKIVGKMMGKLGYESEFAKDGAEAIEMYNTAKKSEKTYDAVILDLTVPGGMGGKEAMENLLEMDSEVKAIVSSGYSDDPVLSNFQEYGFKGVIPKPFNTLSLGQVLHKVLQGEKLKIGN